MEMYFNEGYIFTYNEEKWIIVNIDYEDDEWPYECYPLRVVEKAKQILENGGIVDDDQDFVYDNYVDILDDVYIDERECLSEQWLFEAMHEASQKEIEKLKEEIAKLKGDS